MKNHKKISVITVTWNRADLLEEAIQSVLNQNYDNFEHIVVDNASTDHTLEILNKYKHLKWISEPDNGQSDAMNKGLKLASGEIFAWLNDDDYYEPGAFEKINSIFDLNTYSIVYGTCNIIGKNRSIIGKSNFHKFNRQRLMLGHNNINTPAVFANLRFINNAGLMDESLFATFDLDMWIKVTALKPALAIPDKLTNLRLHPKSGLMSEKKHLSEKRIIRNRYKSEITVLNLLFMDLFWSFRSYLFDAIKMNYIYKKKI